MRRRDLLLPSLALGAGQAQRNSGDPWRAFLAGVEELVPPLMREYSVPGLSIAVIKDARLAWRRGFGVKDVQSNSPITPETAFEAASMSKPVFAYAVLQLSDQGILALDTPLTKYAPDRYLKDDPKLDLITARHVLSHTSGFQNWRTPAEPLKIHFTPGAQYLYSGEGFSYLQSVVTRLTGHAYRKPCGRYEANVEFCATDIDAHMKSRVFAPFEMNSSGYVWNGLFAKLMARPHDENGKPQKQKKPNAADAARYASSGGLLTTPSDYARFLIEVMNPKSFGRFHLARKTLDEMLRPQVKVESTDEYTISWGLGFRLAKTKTATLIGHGGNNTGFHSTSEVSMERQAGYVIMTNGENGYKLNDKLAPQVSQRLYSL